MHACIHNLLIHFERTDYVTQYNYWNYKLPVHTGSSKSYTSSLIRAKYYNSQAKYNCRAYYLNIIISQLCWNFRMIYKRHT
jgi:hypothetical protein